MAVHLCGEVILREDELFKGMNPIGGNHQLFALRWVFNNLKLLVELLEIKHTVFHATKVRISEQVILLVGIQRAGHDRFQNWLAVTVGQQGNYLPYRILPNQVNNVLVRPQQVLRQEFVNSRCAVTLETIANLAAVSEDF